MTQIYNIDTLIIKDENPWDVKSIYEFQYFNCPSCNYKDQSKQEFIYHAHEIHPEAINHLNDIQDGSLRDINFPWTNSVLEEEVPSDLIQENIIKTKEEPIDPEIGMNELTFKSFNWIFFENLIFLSKLRDF